MAKRKATRKAKGTVRGKKLSKGKKMSRVKPLTTIYVNYTGLQAAPKLETNLPPIPPSAISG